MKTSWHTYGNKMLGALVDLQPNHPCSKTGNILSLQHHRHRPQSMQSRVYETVKRPSVCLSYRSTAAAACGGFAAERRAGRRSRSTAGAALSNKCGQCHADSRDMRLNTDYRSAEVSAYANSALHLYSRRY